MKALKKHSTIASDVENWSAVERDFISLAAEAEESPFDIIDTLKNISPASASSLRNRSTDKKVHYIVDQYEINRELGANSSDDFSP